jgi:hypothetical protein
VKSVGRDQNPPCSVVDSGKVIREGLDEALMTYSEFAKVLKTEGIALEKIFFMSAASDGEYVIIRKGEGRSTVS